MSSRRALTALTLRNARCFGPVTTTIPLHPRATVILGENGAGKSTVTEVLAALGDDDPETPPIAPWRRGADDGEAALFDGSDTPIAMWAWSRDGGDRFDRTSTPRLFAYGPYRRVLRDDDRWSAADAASRSASASGPSVSSRVAIASVAAILTQRQAIALRFVRRAFPLERDVAAVAPCACAISTRSDAGVASQRRGFVGETQWGNSQHRARRRQGHRQPRLGHGNVRQGQGKRRLGHRNARLGHRHARLGRVHGRLGHRHARLGHLPRSSDTRKRPSP